MATKSECLQFFELERWCSGILTAFPMQSLSSAVSQRISLILACSAVSQWTVLVWFRGCKPRSCHLTGHYSAILENALNNSFCNAEFVCLSSLDFHCWVALWPGMLSFIQFPWNRSLPGTGSWRQISKRAVETRCPPALGTPADSPKVLFSPSCIQCHGHQQPVGKDAIALLTFRRGFRVAHARPRVASVQPRRFIDVYISWNLRKTLVRLIIAEGAIFQSTDFNSGICSMQNIFEKFADVVLGR